ncbi:MAG: hypothetical protein QHJ73_05855 [Armatimonadota bacterium]|nr:hypothetical protein [Armatimonadota bacterium]
MGLEDWLQSGRWASAASGRPDLGEAAEKALEGLGGLFDRGRRKARKAGEESKKRLQEVYQKSELPHRVEAAMERADAVRERASTAVEKTLRFVREKPAARIARAGVQIKAGLTGFGAGYFFPDAEVLFLGAAGRGRWLVQSGVPVWGAEKLVRKLLLDRPPGELTPAAAQKWDARRELHGTVAAPLLTGFSTGLGVRLVHDALNLRGVGGGFRIIVGGREEVVERIWMLANGLWCFSMGKDLLMVTLGRSQSQSLSELLQRLRERQHEEEEEEDV